MIIQFKIFEKLDKDRQKMLDDELYHSSKVKSSLQRMRQLIKDGANVNAIQPNGYTPLLRAAYFMFTSGAKLLIKNGANINAQNHDGYTSLMLAAVNTYDFITKKRVKEIIDILIENNADLNIQNISGKDAFDVNQHLQDYISNKFPEKYQEYIERKEASKYNL